MVNEGLPLHIVDDLRRRYDLGRMTVGFWAWRSRPRATISRASLSYKFKKVLKRRRA